MVTNRIKTSAKDGTKIFKACLMNIASLIKMQASALRKLY